MDRISVSSSAVRSIGNDAVAAILEVEFTSGRVYQYQGVPTETYEEIMRAESKGKYLNTHIKERFPFRRVV